MVALPAKSACPVRGAGCESGATAEPVRHRQTKGAATDMFDLQPPRHISTLRNLAVRSGRAKCRLITPSRSLPALVAKASVRGRRCHLPEDVPVRSEARCFR